MPYVPNNSELQRNYRERLAKEAFYRQLPEAQKKEKKDSDKAIPAAEVVHVSANLVSPGCPQLKQLCHLHAQASLGHSCHRQKKKKKKKPCIYAHRVTLVVSSSLQPCGLWPTRHLCQAGSPGKNTGVYWPILVAVPFSVQFSSVTQSCLTLCNPMNRSMPGLPVHHQLPEFTQTCPSSR